jgi:hypothetical protein
MQITAVPRGLVKTYLKGVRLPLTAVERLRGGEDESWAPALLFETFEVKAKTVAGSVLRDPLLTQEAGLQRAKVTQLKRAAELEAEAAATRAAADAKLEADTEAAEQRRLRVEREAAQREEQLARQKAEEQSRVAQQAQAREAAARKTQASRQKAVTSKERSAKLTRLSEEQAALGKRREAVSAAGTAVAVDEALERTKARRKNR